MSAVLNPPATAPTLTAQEKLRQLLAERGLADTPTAEHIAKTGAGLWDSDEEFDEFLAILRKLRHEGEPST